MSASRAARMTAYRHITNLHKPFDDVDSAFLDLLGDYKIGDPVKVGPKCNSVRAMKALGYVGIFTTREVRNANPILSCSGWDEVSEAAWNRQPELAQ